MERFESQFPTDYKKGDITKIIAYVLQGKFCQLISVPGGGKATVLKLLANSQPIRFLHLGEKAKNTYFLYTNLLELPTLTENSIYTFLLLSFNKIQGKTPDNTSLPTDPVILLQMLKDNIDAITNQDKQTLVLLLDHFDEYQNNLTRAFFQMLKSFKSLAKYRFCVVFATRRDLRELVDAELFKEFYDFFVDNTIFLSLYDKIATDFMLSQIEERFGKNLAIKDKDELVNLTGGHLKLTKVAAESILGEDIPIDKDELLKKQIVKGALYELWYFLKPSEQQSLIRNSPTEYLEQIGLTKNGEITIPLFAAFIETVIAKNQKENVVYDEQTKEIKKGATIISDLLSAHEYKFLRFFIQNKERIIEREEVINTVWPESKNIIGISDQAIDQLIFRLRHKIEDDPNNPQHLQTVKGRGFRFIP